MKLLEITSSLTLHVDNPGGQWEEKQQAACKEAGRNSHGAPNRFGSVTGSFSRKALVPVSLLARLKGVMGEQSATREESLSWLKKEMGENNRLPLGSSGKQYAPMVTVDYEGKAWVNEGNHRIKAAHALGWRYLPTEIRYFSGGEKVNANLSPNIVKRHDGEATADSYSPGEDFKGKI